MMTARVLKFAAIPRSLGSTGRVSEKHKAARSSPTAGGRLQTEGELPLADLVARMQRRDETALAELYDLAVARVFSLALRIVRTEADAEEVAVDVFAQAWDTAERFDADRGNVMAWLLAICRSRALDLLRRRSARQNAEERLAAEPLTEEHASGPDDLLAIVETGSIVHAALRELSPERRQVLSLAYLRGYTQEEIAAFTGLPLGTVKSHVRRSLGELREQLQAIGPEAEWS
jgi:RNA polymerase sigma-70 factor (ECF subfamily)